MKKVNNYGVKAGDVFYTPSGVEWRVARTGDKGFFLALARGEFATGDGGGREGCLPWLWYYGDFRDEVAGGFFRPRDETSELYCVYAGSAADNNAGPEKEGRKK